MLDEAVRIGRNSRKEGKIDKERRDAQFELNAVLEQVHIDVFKSLEKEFPGVRPWLILAPKTVKPYI